MHITIPKFLSSYETQSPENQFPEEEQTLDHLGQHPPSSFRNGCRTYTTKTLINFDTTFVKALSQCLYLLLTTFYEII